MTSCCCQLPTVLQPAHPLHCPPPELHVFARPAPQHLSSLVFSISPTHLQPVHCTDRNFLKYKPDLVIHLLITFQKHTESSGYEVQTPPRASRSHPQEPSLGQPSLQALPSIATSWNLTSWPSWRCAGPRSCYQIKELLQELFFVPVELVFFHVQQNSTHKVIPSMKLPWCPLPSGVCHLLLCL